MSDILSKLRKFGKPMAEKLMDAKQHYYFQETWDGKVRPQQPWSDHSIEVAIDRCGLRCRQDMMARKSEFLFGTRDMTRRACEKLGIPAQAILAEMVALVQLRCLHEAKCNPGKRAILDTMDRLAARDRFHPFAEALDEIEWDGVDRWPDWYETIIVHNNYVEPWLKDVYLRKALIQAMQCVYGNCLEDYDDPKQVGHMPLLIGATGVGKTQFVKNLAPREFVTAAKELKLDASSMTSKSDVIMQVTKTVFTEIGEYDATTAKSAVASINNFLTDEVDEGRLVHRLLPFSYPRATCFWASVEDYECIQSLRGMRRIWPIWVESCAHPFNPDHFPLSNSDRWQLLAQAKEEWVKSATYFLDVTEQRAHALQFELHISQDPMVQTLQRMLQEGKRLDVPVQWMNMYDILRHLDDEGWRGLRHDKKLQGQIRETLQKFGIEKQSSKNLGEGTRKQNCYALQLGPLGLSMTAAKPDLKLVEDDD